jgi:hypothetical protein
MHITDLRHLLPIIAIAAALFVVSSAAWAAMVRAFVSRAFPSLTEAAYFAAGCALLIWAAH